jgi:hypothetical protein
MRGELEYKSFTAQISFVAAELNTMAPLGWTIVHIGQFESSPFPDGPAVVRPEQRAFVVMSRPRKGFRHAMEAHTGAEET